VMFAGETKPLELRARFGQPGSYVADLLPTAEGTYSFRIFGTIEGTDIDETFTGGPDTFSEVESTDSIAFPTGHGRQRPDTGHHRYHRRCPRPGRWRGWRHDSDERSQRAGDDRYRCPPGR
jgi:hypothetical protein